LTNQKPTTTNQHPLKFKRIADYKKKSFERTNDYKG
jgi:hypothetical protein